MENKYIDFALKVLEDTASKELFKNINFVVESSDIIGATSEEHNEHYTVTFLTTECIILISYFYEEDWVDFSMLPVKILKDVFKLGIHTWDDFIALEKQFEVTKKNLPI